MSRNIPFIVVHKGNQDYLKSCLSSIEKHYRTILLGNQENKSFSTEWFDLSTFQSSYFDEFDEAYIHMSSNTEEFEKICFHRYIAMYEFAKANEIKEFVHCDSDMVILSDCDGLLKKINMCGAAYLIPKDQSKYRMTASPHFCYWRIDVLEEFIKFFINQYQSKSPVLSEKYNYHLRNNLPGGICDMTLLYLFAKSRIDVINLMQESEYYLNFNVSTLEDYDYQRENILFKHSYVVKNGELFHKSDMKSRKVLFLHMQGRAKKIMRFAERKQFGKLFLSISMLNLLRYINRKVLMRK